VAYEKDGRNIKFSDVMRVNEGQKIQVVIWVQFIKFVEEPDFLRIVEGMKV
jgi:hypothetical protein